MSCAVVHESCADCPTNPAPIRHGVLLMGLVGSSHACFPLTNPPHLSPHPCGSAQGLWDFLLERRRVCGTIRAARAEQRLLSHLQLAHFTWNPTAITQVAAFILCWPPTHPCVNIIKIDAWMRGGQHRTMTLLILAALVLVGLALVGMFVVLVGHVHAQD